LGLEIVGRRSDGYHNLVTIMQSIDLLDWLVWTETSSSFEYDGPRDVAPADDLVLRALRQASDFEHWTGHLQLRKHIPMSAGLGGGSSDAALALRIAFPSAIERDFIERARALGSDVPFFVRGGTALATGVGADLAPLRTPRVWFAVLVPRLTIQHKTHTLYSALEPEDFSDGARVYELATRLAAERPVIDQLPNTFDRPLQQYAAHAQAVEALRRAGAATVGTSGAGPAVFTVVERREQARALAARIPRELGSVHVVHSCLPTNWDAAYRIAEALRGRMKP
jgi:4-diphosphocytidyl-2-C-methyl-D-erythritol kinase